MQDLSDAPDDGSQTLTGTEAALFGSTSVDGIRRLLSDWVEHALDSPIDSVRFRAGRIDVVWGVRLGDGRDVVIKAHRPPTNLRAIGATNDAQHHLVTRGFPCSSPLAGPDEVGGHVLTAETMARGSMPDGRRPDLRRELADGLARHIDILRDRVDLASEVGAGPSWCRYREGPWPTPHDDFVDFTSTVAGFEWLDELGRRASDQIIANRDGGDIVLGHGDWYAGNTVFQDDRLSGTFDWELVADAEPVIVGFAAACFSSSSTAGGGLSSPADARAFLADYDSVTGRPFSPVQRRTAAGAAAWIIAFNARWQVALIEHGLCDEPTLALARDHGEEYLALDY